LIKASIDVEKNGEFLEVAIDCLKECLNLINEKQNGDLN
jgi:hypothetical protein